MSEPKYTVGDTVYILARRSDSGCVCPPPESASAPSYPIVECRVAQVDVCGSKGVYGLVWADTEEPVGLPFSERSLWDSEEELKARVEACMVPM
jgi:hypothetical protein